MCAGWCRNIPVDEMALEAALRSLYAGAAHQRIRHAGSYEGFHVVLAKAVADSLGVPT